MTGEVPDDVRVWRRATEPEPWIVDAACRGIAHDRGNHDMFFGTAEGDQRAVVQALEDYCLRCPVTRECLDYSQRNEVLYGVFGGLQAEQRRVLLNTYGVVTTPRGRGAHLVALEELTNRTERRKNRKARR